MRLSAATQFTTTLVLIPFFTVVSALTLTDFQPINGFAAACTYAYNTPLTDCSNSDFAGQGCSAKCIGFLDSLSKTLTEACAGTTTNAYNLIGLFFNKDGVKTLCPNANEGSSSSAGGDGSSPSGGQNGAYGIHSAVGEASASTTSTSTTSTSFTTSSSTTSTSSTPQAAATTSTTTVVPTTVTPEPTTTSVAIVGTTVAAESPSDAMTSTTHSRSSTASSSTSTSTGNDIGGGTPLDIGSSACRDAAMSVWLFALLAGLAGVLWLL